MEIEPFTILKCERLYVERTINAYMYVHTCVLMIMRYCLVRAIYTRVWYPFFFLSIIPHGCHTREKRGQQQFKNCIQVDKNISVGRGLVQVSGCGLESLWQLYETCKRLAWLVHTCTCIHSLPDDPWNWYNFHMYFIWICFWQREHISLQFW